MEFSQCGIKWQYLSTNRAPLVAPGPFWQAEIKGSSMVPANRANVSVGLRVTQTGAKAKPATSTFAGILKIFTR